ncbi:PREDICTED: uncharacterized protein LOC104792678 [Camelina sativa]|uniref:Uncharacterized protein LOC104792674 n=1 Tax=Camelina sativa TaxID=90675 RepID=A0ABM0ZKY0_CAMSA|nr:PREDICTED: uncharacterized protein LOC104792674 [Camelina sativa]XP_010517179.1 PREDICTED: uncharacterized protein LOC104792675 [Camelina sativa]XP_010517184.1 PREDICTED: uncharacterized protein LOC104792678 [Camelina sativa]
MMREDKVIDRNHNLSVNDIDLSLLRITSPPPYYDYSPSPSLLPADEITPPLKRASPVSDDSDQSKRRKLSPQEEPIFITSPLLFTSRENNQSSSSVHDPNLTSPVLEKQDTTPSASDTETMNKVNHCVEEMNRGEVNYAYEQEEVEQEEEEECGGGMRIERSGDGFVIRLKCRCRQAFRVLFSDHHLYFKPL